jgi:hypothetical protein
MRTSTASITSHMQCYTVNCIIKQWLLDRRASSRIHHTLYITTESTTIITTYHY